jgi:hypothetical protein
MRTTPLLATLDNGFSRGDRGKFTLKYRCRSCARNRGLVQVQRRDRVHDTLAKSSIEALA